MSTALWATRRVPALACVVLSATACERNPDLSRAIDAGIGRTVGNATPPAEGRWIDLAQAAPENQRALGRPVSACWSGERLIVADGAQQRLLIFVGDGELQGSVGFKDTGEGGLFDVSLVRCAVDANLVLAVDPGLRRVSFFDLSDGFLRSVPAPETPQVKDIPGDFALLGDGVWFDSWLGSGLTLGPYLLRDEWAEVGLVRAWRGDGEFIDEFGRPVLYNDPVATRVLNRVFLAAYRDTLWLLTQGDATIHGFDRHGRAAKGPIRLPVYYRGKEPDITVRAPIGGNTGFRYNKMLYDPNVAGLSVVHDSLFAVVRYRDWGWRFVNRSGWVINRVARSAVELIDRDGSVVGAFSAPGMAFELTANGGDRIALLTKERDGTVRVLVTRLEDPA